MKQNTSQIENIQNKSSEKTNRAVVIGAGMGGLAISIRLAASGYQVDVLEQNAFAGGKVALIEKEGFRWDAGPSLFTLPENMEELFQIAGVDIRDRFAYDRLEETCRYFWEDGTKLTAHADGKAFAKEMDKVLQVGEEKVLEFLKRSKKNYETAAELFLYRSMHKLSTWTNPKARKAYLNLPFKSLLSTMAGYNTAFFNNEKATQLFNRFATYNGSDPYQAPALLNVIPHLEHGKGAYFPKGGMISIPKALTDLAKELGVKFHFNNGAKQIEISNGKAVGVYAESGFYPADVVVSNLDVFHTYRKLLPDQPAPEKILRQPRSSSGIIFYWGIKKEFPQLGLHNIFFSEDYRKEFDAIFKQKQLHPDPTVYVNISSKLNPTDAPSGMENWFVLMNVPSNVGQDWDRMVEDMRGYVLKKLSRMLEVDMSTLIGVEEHLDPVKIEGQTGSYAGSLYGTSSNSKWAAFFRHANFSKNIKGMYFTGGSVHPGGGIPLSLLSGRIVHDLIMEREKA